MEENGEPPCPNRQRPPEAFSRQSCGGSAAQKTNFRAKSDPVGWFLCLSHFEGERCVFF